MCTRGKKRRIKKKKASYEEGMATRTHNLYTRVPSTINT
jgi:hypothetical protein